MDELVIGLTFKEDEHEEATNDGGDAGEEKAACILETGIANSIAWTVCDLEKNEIISWGIDLGSLIWEFWIWVFNSVEI